MIAPSPRNDVATGNRRLAGHARKRAAAAAPGSLARRAYGCAAVALATTGTIQAARAALGNVWPADVQTAAIAALGELARAEMAAHARGEEGTW